MVEKIFSAIRNIVVAIVLGSVAAALFVVALMLAPILLLLFAAVAARSYWQLRRLRQKIEKEFENSVEWRTASPRPASSDPDDEGETVDVSFVDVTKPAAALNAGTATETATDAKVSENKNLRRK